MTTIAYLRISTDKQDQASQESTIRVWATRQNVTINGTSADTASGSMPWQQRSIAGVLDSMSKGDAIVVAEISRIARSTVGVLTFLQAAAEKGVAVHAIRSGITLDNSMSAKIVVTMLALAAEVERDLLRDRTKAALQARKDRGLPVGRQTGATGKRNKLSGRMHEIKPLLDAKISQSAIARLLGVSRMTLHSFLISQEVVKHDQID